MPGIAGIAYPPHFQVTHLIHPMLEAMRHRHQHQEYSTDIFSAENLQIATVGDRGFSNSHKTLWVGLDGHLTNLEALRQELKTLGRHFIGHRQEEVILQAYEAWGDDFVKKLHGAFAIAIFDTKTRTILLARDRLGICPLYWAHERQHFLFGSELKALMQTKVLSPLLAEEALGAYLFFGYIPQDMTPIRHANKLLPGYLLKYHLDDHYTLSSYWSYSSCFTSSLKETDEEVAHHLNNLLLKAVAEQQIPNQKAACFVSGGLGSASIAHYLGVQQGFPPLSYSAFFAGEYVEDHLACEKIARALALDFQAGTVHPFDLLDLLPKMLWHLDEPIADPNILLTWRLCEMAEKTASTIFTGMGSDEVLGGHQRYLLSLSGNTSSYWMQKLPPKLCHNVLLPLASLFGPTAHCRALKTLHQDPVVLQYLQASSIVEASDLQSAFPRMSPIFDPATYAKKFYRLSSLEPGPASFMYLDMKMMLPDRFLLTYDRMAAAHGLRFAFPFLDHKIVEYLARIPTNQKVHGGETALPLKRLLAPLLPQEILYRPKTSRKNLLSTWLANTQLQETFQLLLRGNLVDTNWVSKKWLAATLASPAAQKRHASLLWSILLLEVWFRLFVSTPLSKAPSEMTTRQLLDER